MKFKKYNTKQEFLKENIKEMYQDNFRGRECSEEESPKVSEAF